MIRIDISRAIPSGLGVYLLGIVPGLFFESSIAVGNPALAALIVSRLRQIHPFGPYALLVIFLASSLFIGQALFLLGWITDLLIAFGFAIWRSTIRMTFGSDWLYRNLAKLKGTPPKQGFLLSRLERVMFWARMRDYSADSRPVLKCLRVATDQLLKDRYGIDATDNRYFGGNEWGIWYSVLGKTLPDLQAGAVAGRTFLGCGVAGLISIYIAPALRTGVFIGLCSVFAFAGLFVAVSFARWKNDPVRRSMIRLRQVLAELAEVNRTVKRNDDLETAIAAAIDE